MHLANEETRKCTHPTEARWSLFIVWCNIDILNSLMRSASIPLITRTALAGYHGSKFPDVSLTERVYSTVASLDM